MAKMVATGMWNWAGGLDNGGDDNHSMKIILLGLCIS